jgi:hypothetical protein
MFKPIYTDTVSFFPHVSSNYPADQVGGQRSPGSRQNTSDRIG